jgi:arsenate reductase (thioredoxin)
MQNKKILILCTGNSCRSQMAHGFLQSFDKNLQVFSAGTKPETKVNPFAIKVMKEDGIDISTHVPKKVTAYIHQSFDYVITVCDNAKESCPIFIGEVKKRLHFGFTDPASARGTEDEITSVYRLIRDEIKKKFRDFYTNDLKI